MITTLPLVLVLATAPPDPGAAPQEDRGAWALGTLRNLPPLRPTPVEPADPTLRLALGLAGAPATGELLERLGSTDPAERLWAVRRVERRGVEGSPEAIYVPALVRLLRDPDLQTRGLAALALSHHLRGFGEHVPVFVVEGILVGIRDENAHVATFCKRALANSEASRTIQRLTPRLKDSAVTTQRATALRLRSALEAGGLPTPDTLAGFGHGIRGNDLVLRRLCTEGLAACGTAAERTLCALLADKDAEVRMCAMEAILQMTAHPQQIPWGTTPGLHLQRMGRESDMAERVLDAMGRAYRVEKEP
jgi:hypothetical protein